MRALEITSHSSRKTLSQLTQAFVLEIMGSDHKYHGQ